jgi:CubicO group peptidase (beta-lactamase class C family)
MPAFADSLPEPAKEFRPAAPPTGVKPPEPAMYSPSASFRAIGLALLMCLAAALPACGGGGKDNYPDYDNPRQPASISLTPASTGDGWTTSTPAAEGLNTDQITATLNAIRDGQFPGVDSIVIARHQRLVAEGYYNGYDRDTVHDLRSTGKSFISTLAGIAFDQGLVNIDDRLSTHIPDFESHRHMDDAKRAITLRHLLNMSTGLECNDGNESSPGWEERVYSSPDWIRFVLDLRMVSQPGTTPSYCTGGVVLLGHVISLRSSLALDAFAQQWLFDPLEIRQSVWRRSPDGRATGATGFGLRPRDAAKLGALFAGEGVWNGRRVVSEAWALETRRSVVDLGAGYGYLWWKRTFPHATGPMETVFSAGNGGNYVFVVPSRELVVAFTGSNYSTSLSQTPFRILPMVLAAVP